MNQREFKHTSGPWKVTDDGLWIASEWAVPSGGLPETVAVLAVFAGGTDRGNANARLLTASPTLCALLAEIEAAIFPLLPDIDPVIGMRKRVKELLDVIEKGEVSE